VDDVRPRRKQFADVRPNVCGLDAYPSSREPVQLRALRREPVVGQYDLVPFSERQLPELGADVPGPEDQDPTHGLNLVTVGPSGTACRVSTISRA